MRDLDKKIDEFIVVGTDTFANAMGGMGLLFVALYFSSVVYHWCQ